MDFETGMENLTSVRDADCDCSPDPTLLVDFKRAIHALGGKWKLERIVGMAIAYPYFLNNAAKVLSRRKDMADLLVGVAGDFIPPRLVLGPRFLFNLFISPAFRN